jgi:DNA-directed RNA polymerase specialized sigma24 family protein
MTDPNDVARNPLHYGAFKTTRWSIVLRVGGNQEEEARAALEGLCRDYWRPLFDFARGKGHGTEDAQDLTQGFIANLLATESFAKADPSRGRFRTFLLGAFCRYMVSDFRGQTALKRGGGQRLVPLDEPAMEGGHEGLWQTPMTPEREYERSWALALLERTMARLRGEYQEAGRSALFKLIEPHITGGGGRPGYANIAASLEMSETAVTVAVHRMRKRYGQLLREEIAGTVSAPEEVEDELRHLLDVLSSP